jgi:hypothetical protein
MGDDSVSDFFSLSPENRKSVTVIETIGCMHVKMIPPVIIVPGAIHMESWYRNQAELGLRSNQRINSIRFDSSEFERIELVIP